MVNQFNELEIEYVEDIMCKFKKSLDIKIVRNQIVDTIRGYDNTDKIKGIYLFGSRAKGQANIDSDLDIGVFLDDELDFDLNIWKPKTIEEISSRLEDLLGYKIDFILHYLKHGSLSLAFNIASGLELYAVPDFKKEVFKFKLNKILNNDYLL